MCKFVWNISVERLEDYRSNLHQWIVKVPIHSESLAKASWGRARQFFLSFWRCSCFTFHPFRITEEVFFKIPVVPLALKKPVRGETSSRSQDLVQLFSPSYSLPSPIPLPSQMRCYIHLLFLQQLNQVFLTCFFNHGLKEKNLKHSFFQNHVFSVKQLLIHFKRSKWHWIWSQGLNSPIITFQKYKWNSGSQV